MDHAWKDKLGEQVLNYYFAPGYDIKLRMEPGIFWGKYELITHSHKNVKISAST